MRKEEEQHYSKSPPSFGRRVEGARGEGGIFQNEILSGVRFVASSREVVRWTEKERERTRQDAEKGRRRGGRLVRMEGNRANDRENGFGRPSP
jgi:hypothetical protein